MIYRVHPIYLHCELPCSKSKGLSLLALPPIPYLQNVAASANAAFKLDEQKKEYSEEEIDGIEKNGHMDGTITGVY